MKREQAWRVFAGEFNDATTGIKGQGEKSPSYVVTPLGSKINRLYFIGVLTDVENTSEEGSFLRAHVSDPTGVFTLYSGQFQQEATNQLQSIEVPSFVAVIGKARTYEPEEGSFYVSVRPEIVREVSTDARDRWILETCKRSKQRIEAITEALKMNEPSVKDIQQLGYSRDLAEGIVTALAHYGTIDVSKYISLITESLQYIAPEEQPQPDIQESPPEPVKQKKVPKQKQKKPQETPSDESNEEVEETILALIKNLEGEEGAAWDEIVETCKKKGLDENTIEEALTSLMDKGFIYEPVLGTLKTT